MIEQIVPGIVCGLIAWGGIRVEMRWLRSDVSKLEERVKELERRP